MLFHDSRDRAHSPEVAVVERPQEVLLRAYPHLPAGGVAVILVPASVITGVVARVLVEVGLIP
jgi:hypothetical protein